MLVKWTKIAVLALVCSGLCPAAHANTTVSGARTPVAARISATAWTAQDATLPKLAQNDLALPPQGIENVPSTSEIPFSSGMPSVPSSGPVRVAVLLPLRSATLGAAAEAVRSGIEAAYEREKEGILVTFIATDGTPSNVLSNYTDAAAYYDMVIGPLARSEVTAIAQGGNAVVTKPTIALAQPEAPGDADMVAPAKMLPVGLSIEEEARQMANTINDENAVAGPAYVISTNIAWQRRAAKAFVLQWQRLGRQAHLFQLNMPGGYISADNVAELKKQMEAQPPGLIFVAMNAGQTSQLRLAIDSNIPIFGTSQLNPYTLPDWQTAERLKDLDGVRLVDIPWQLQADHPAVMVYPRPVVSPDQPHSADMARLYALGIDAYRIAREAATKHVSFELDGVTGKLIVDFGAANARFRRIEQQAIYQDGKVVPLTATLGTPTSDAATSNAATPDAQR